MKERIFVIHRWSGRPNTDWYPWLKTELEARGYEVFVPLMPHPETPTIEDYVVCLSEAVGVPDRQTHFVGHSIGCQTIMRYLAGIQTRVGKVVFVGGWFDLKGLEDEEAAMIAKPWIETPIDFERIRQNAQNITAIFSDDDNYVDLGNKELFEQNLNARIFIKHKKGHFTKKSGVTELPIVLEQFVE
ncbi:MAG: hypothetical protein A3I31_00040 [Candidatus Colwellbacteria bacterium RIFCSPLOWO2_02_FULL_44_20b]|uniref:Alpha/beta hydrolase n=1 Tax=Candidatus Colwellbacteria bacterium RIFCSPLOWO2_02_FULL_44_20b TaxID=1797691 RepID=A0A1G1Z7E0_9BACT|nr:MAG: hypothetical protein A3I31_00040 [Candidatus Colwellbacteria bacterium RIFCSPLOWO2_02_FULL_44_20b]